MGTTFAENKQKIIDALNTKALKCATCEGRNMILLDGFILIPLQDDLGTYNLGGQNVPSVAVACSNCGCIHHFATKVLVPSI